MGKKEIEHIYPLTIVKDRYGGGYSKGHYLALVAACRKCQ